MFSMSLMTPSGSSMAASASLNKTVVLPRIRRKSLSIEQLLLYLVFGARANLVDDLTQQPPAKAGGLELWTESPDTRRLNDAS